MSFRFHPFLINDRFGDPGVYLDFRFEKRGILLDLGDIGALPKVKLRQTSDLLITHAHMDHFIGFDRVLRANLRQEREIGLFGPEGITDHVANRLGGYSWNLASNTSPDLVFTVTEMQSLTQGRRTRFSFRNRFQPEPQGQVTFSEGKLQDDHDVSIRATILDHKLPCLAFTVVEAFSLNVDARALKDAGLKAGRWIDELKKAVRTRTEPDALITVDLADGGTDRRRIGDLAAAILHEGRGQKIAYVVDCLYSDRNIARIIDLADGADILFIEAAFLAADQDLADDRYHLTAEQAGLLAAMAGVARVEPMHFSHRYAGHGRRVIAEVRRAFEANRA